MQFRWVPVSGEASVESPNHLRFPGGTSTYTTEEGEIKHDGAKVAQMLSDARFSGGKVSATINFKKISERLAAGITLMANPELGAHLSVILGSGPLCSVRMWPGISSQNGSTGATPTWTDYGAVGSATSLLENHDYHLEVSVTGSRVVVVLDGVQLINTDLKYSVPKYTLGAWFFSKDEIDFRDFRVSSVSATAFVVMEFTESFNDLYAQVIKPICEQFSVETLRADERYGPGSILTDIQKQIVESSLIIADITPMNANVFYEVGYAHALRKPTILLAQRGTKLPFDISGFRTIFYDNTINGKAKVEEGLQRHLKAVLSGTL
ncbi:TIR domain-containing protein [Herbaspirillum autotrophicum]|uniref:hypothetical protein n=1 Tax=Herbaspirillum autotrophicum TaxID=180195 RepID=UPI000A9C52D3|nr:hypothetical protein [Herbaspirillum autotrophicum]